MMDNQEQTQVQMNLSPMAVSIANMIELLIIRQAEGLMSTPTSVGEVETKAIEMANKIKELEAEVENYKSAANEATNKIKEFKVSLTTRHEKAQDTVLARYSQFFGI